MTVTQTKPEFLTEALIEVCNNEWKVLSLENGRSVYTQLEMEVGRKYIKVWSYLVSGGERLNGNSCWMFVDKNYWRMLQTCIIQSTCKRCPLSDHSVGR